MARTTKPARQQLWPDLPVQVRFIIVNYLIGAAAGLVLGATLLLSNTLGLRDLVTDAADPWTPTLLLLAGPALTFAAVQAAASIMLLERS